MSRKIEEELVIDFIKLVMITKELDSTVTELAYKSREVNTHALQNSIHETSNYMRRKLEMISSEINRLVSQDTFSVFMSEVDDIYVVQYRNALREYLDSFDRDSLA